MLQPNWTRSVEGVRPGLLLADDRILFYHETADGQPGTRLACFDLDGRQLWSRPATTGLLALPGGRFLVTTPQREPLLLDGGGRVLGRWRRGAIVAAEGHGDRILLAGSGRIWATDCDLNPLWGVAWPDDRYPALDCLVGDALYWVEQDELRFITRAGRAEVLGRVPTDLVAEAMDRHERTTGTSALLGGYVLAQEGAGYTPFRAGDRPSWFYWRVSFDPALGCFFLANSTAPHLIACLDHKGRPRWCQYLSFGCCGGVPAALPDGRYVASSGCGGILSWLDANGNVLLQSRPHEGVGLATAYSNEVRVLPDGRVLVGGGPGVVAFTLRGRAGAVVVFSPDGGTLAVGGDDGIVTLWDVATARESFTLKGHTNRVAATAFAPDGKTLATGSWDATVKLWDVATGRLNATLKGHQGSAVAVAFTPDGKRVASACTYHRVFREGGPRGGISKIEDGCEVLLWQPETEKVAARFEPDRGHNLIGLAVTTNGKSLVTVGRDGIVKQWGLAGLGNSKP